MSIKENIRKLLSSEKVSNYKISKDTGIAQATLSDYASGKSKIGNMKLDHAIKLNKYWEELKMMKNIKSIKDLNFERMALSTFTGLTAVDEEKTLYTAGYSVPKENLSDQTSNHYRATWDLSDFFANEESFDWEMPHSFKGLGNINNEDDKVQIESFLNHTEKYAPYNKMIDIGGTEVEILHRPYNLHPNSMDVIYNALAKDSEGNYYRLYWNVINLHEPVEIKLTVDYTRQCKHCLQPWMDKETKCIKGNHEYITA